jgi:vancomycin permeability regulator SanA
VRRGEQGGIFFRLLFLLFFFAILAVIFAARHPLMRYAAQSWVLDEPVAPSDALIVLGDDNYAADRAFHAAELYREGVAPVVVASGRMLRRDVSIADVMQHDLDSFGVPAAAVVKLTHRAQNTREEAAEAARLIKARGWKRIMVVTSNYHTRRARFIFERTLPPGVTLRVSAARDSEFDPSRWWETRQGQNLFFTELAGYVEARWELRDRAAAVHESALRNSYREFGSFETCIYALCDSRQSTTRI